MSTHHTLGAIQIPRGLVWAESGGVVLVLRDVEGFDVAEIASLLDVGPAAAKMRLQHARRMLRAALGLRLAPSEAP